MKPFLKAILLLWLLAGAVPAMAQDPDDADPAATDLAGEQAAAEADAAQDADPDPAAPPAEPPADAESDPGALVEEDARVAASAEEEFNPDEEISEDYPVPLPSDI